MTGETVKIVMIEDDDGHALLLERTIRRSGINNAIQRFSDGASAINYLLGEDRAASAHNGHTLLILLDLNLPDMTGLDILKTIRENDVLKTMPVVILTTTSDTAEIERCYEFGCNVYLTKPIDHESFTDAIRQIGLFFSVIQVTRTAT